MARQLSFLQEPRVSARYANPHSLDLTALYNQYAPALLGVIIRIVSDEEQAAELLIATFAKARAEISQYRPEAQPVFTWLLGIARCIALDALRERTKAPTPVIELASTGKVMTLPASPAPMPAALADSVEPKLRELLDSVLFKNCTPEEAARTLGIPVETARQQLRLAMQQLRSAQLNRSNAH